MLLLSKMAVKGAIGYGAVVAPKKMLLLLRRVLLLLLKMAGNGAAAAAKKSDAPALNGAIAAARDS
jgi:hypothetical protein